jgi:PAS domain S-box-containing protein
MAQHSNNGGRQNVRFFENALAFSEDQVFILDNKGRFVYANPAGIKLLDVKADELIGNRWADMEAPPETREPFDIRLSAVYAARKPFKGTVKYSLDGAKKFFEYTLNPVINAEGEVESVIVISRDATERRLAEEALKENNYYNASLLRLYKSLGQATTYTAIINALGGEIEKTLGYKSVWLQLLKEDTEDLLLLDAGGPVEQKAKILMQLDDRYLARIGDEKFLVLPTIGDPYLSTAIHADDIYVVEDAPTHPLTNKEIVAVSGNRTITSVPLTLAEKTLGVFCMGTFGDEGVLVPTPRQLDYLRTLANHVAVALDRVRFLTERKEAERALELKARELTRSNKELEEFAYVASHDLQEPLRMVSSYVQLLAKRYEGKLDKDADEFINYAVEGAARMKDLIDDLLEYSRVAPREKVPTDCAVIFKQVLMSLEPLIEENNATVTSGDLPTINSDPTQLAQLFLNLISNAIKFRREEPPKVHVSAEKQGNEWVFAVKDNGMGIDPQYFDRIFTVFQRLHTREKYSGTGVGLALCKKIVEGQGGRIWVESEPGVGSVFYFTLPTG